MKYLKIYEKFNTKDVNEYDLIRDLDRSEVADYYYNNFYEPEYYEPSWGDLIDYFSTNALWGYVNEVGFVDDWVVNKVYDLENNWDGENFDKEKLIDFISDWTHYDDVIREFYISDHLNISEDDENYEKTKAEVEEKSIADILNEFDENNLKKIIENRNEINSFCRKYCDDKYENYGAKDLMEELGYDVESSNVFYNDDENIRDYMDYGYMSDDYNQKNPYEEDYSVMVDALADSLSDNRYIQKMVYDNNPEENAFILVKNNWVSNQLKKESQFQLDYVIGLLENKEEIRNETVTIFNKLKENFLKDGIEICADVIEKYELEALIEGWEKGFFGK